MRVVSLDPACTEILGAAGGADLLVGRSSACDAPAAVDRVPVVATGGAVDADLLRSLRPEVILAGAGELARAAADLAPAAEVIALAPRRFEDVLDGLLRVGAAIGRERASHSAMIKLRDRYWTAVDYVNPYAAGPAVAFLTGADPLAAGGPWIPPLIEAAGARAVCFGGAAARERPAGVRVTVDDVIAAQPDRIIVAAAAGDPAVMPPALARLVADPRWPALPGAAHGALIVVAANGPFARPGPRLAEAFRWLVGWINDRPELIPPGFPAAAPPPSAA